MANHTDNEGAGIPISCDRPGWQARAACLDEDPRLFFPIGPTGPALAQAERAKRVCAVCPVKAICLEWALRTRQPHGVWGGLDEDERRDLRSARVRWRKAAPDQPDGRDGR